MPKQLDEHDIPASSTLSSSSLFRPFEPPLYIQRYDLVIEFLNEYKCRSMLDIGCAESKLLRYCKNSNDNQDSHLNLLIGLDLDEECLKDSRQKFNSILFDFVHARKQPLDLILLHGDISRLDDYFKLKLKSQIDFVTMIEVIEHMLPDVLERSIKNVFEHLEPRLVLITTPNKDFNVVFNNNTNENQMRHWDHKFEWTRQEFESWCFKSIIHKYESKYDLLKFGGLGDPPKQFQEDLVGKCTQYALFIKKDIENNSNDLSEFYKLKKRINIEKRCRDIYIESNFDDFDTYLDENSFESYKQILHISYPFESFEFETKEQRNKCLLNDLKYYLAFMTKGSQSDEMLIRDDFDDCYYYLCDLNRLCEYQTIRKYECSKQEIANILIENRYKLSDDENFVYYESPYHNNSIYDNETENESWDCNDSTKLQFEDSPEDSKSNLTFSSNSSLVTDITLTTTTSSSSGSNNCSHSFSNQNNNEFVLMDGDRQIKLTLFNTNYYFNRSMNFSRQLKKKAKANRKYLKEKFKENEMLSTSEQFFDHFCVTELN